MGEEDYRIQGDRQPRSAAPGVTTGPVGAADERPWTALAHPGAFLNFFTLFLGPVAAFGVWLAYGERSPAARHAMGGVDYQSVSLVAHSLGRSVSCILTAFVVGVLLWPGMGVLTLAFFGHALCEGYLAYRGDGAFVYR